MAATRLMRSERCYPMFVTGLFIVCCLMMLIWANQGHFQAENMDVLGPLPVDYAIESGLIEAPNANSAQDHFDTTNGDTPSETSECALHERLNLMDEVCSTLANRDLAVKEDDYDDVMAVVNHDKRIFFGMVTKAGSRDLTRYFERLNKMNSSLMAQATENGSRVSVRYRYGSLSAETLMKLEGFNRVSKISLTNVQRLFPNYTKLIQVRHPLQRFVSGYYQRVIYKQKLQYLEFPKFVEEVLAGLCDRHWMPYYTNTYPCTIRYDIVLKVETSERDQVLIRDIFGWGSTIDNGHLNPNFNITDTPRSVYYKYDDLLNDFRMKHPSLFNRLLAFLQPDMDMFGYTWDEAAGSSCSYSAVNCC